MAQRRGRSASVPRTISASTSRRPWNCPAARYSSPTARTQDVRALVIFDVKWLYEPRRRSAFENGLADWSTHKYIKGIVGHCAYNRVPGPGLIPHPDKARRQGPANPSPA